MATKTQTPIEALERCVNSCGALSKSDTDKAWFADAREALSQVKALVVSVRRIKDKVEVGRSGSYTRDDVSKAIAWIDAECNIALVPFQVKP